MPESSSSQCSTPATPLSGSNVVTTSDDQWNKVDSSNTSNIVQTETPQEWSQFVNPNVVTLPVTSNSASSDYQVTSSNNINIWSDQLVYNPPNYINLPYQRNTVPNGNTIPNPARAINAPIINGPNVIRTQNGPIIGRATWPNQIHQTRFVNQPAGWNGSKTSGGVKKQKRIRTAFTSQQMVELEQEYARNRYLDRARRIELSDTLRLNERTIKIWFQNRRMKEKKDRAESLEESEEASTSESSPEIMNMQVPMPMLIHEQYPGPQNEVYNHGNVFVEQYPVTSAPVPMPATSLVTEMAPVQAQTQNMYPTYMTQEETQAQYQQVHFQVQPYNTISQYSEVKESPPEVLPKPEPESSTPNSSSNIIEKSWDLSWLRMQDFIKYEEEYNS